MTLSLRNKANLVILITYALIVLTYIAIQLPVQNRQMEKAMHRTQLLLQAMVEREREPLANEIFERRTRAIAIRIHQMHKVEGILAISVFDAQGRLLLTDTASERTLSVQDPALTQQGILIRQGAWQGHDVLFFIRAIDVVGERIGFIRIVYGLDDVVREQRQSYWIFGGFLIAILVIMLGLLNTFLNRVVIAPVTSLRDFMQRMDPTSLGEQIKTRSRDEIGDLTRTFNAMSQDLAGSYRQIADQHAQLNQMRLYLKNIIDSMHSMILSVNEEGFVVEWNEAAQRATGITDKEAIGKLLWQILPGLQVYEEALREVIQTRQPREFHRVVHVTEKGEEYQNITVFPLIADRVQGVVIRIDNVTELERKEQQLRQAQKMETIGTLAGGLAHDFNNILGGITGSLSLLKYKLSQGAAVDRNFLDKYLNTIEDATNRAVDLVQQLLSLSRKQELVFEPVNLNTTIEHVLKICRNSFDKRIELTPEYFAGEAMVKANQVQMEQVLLNLCVNAAHAMTFMRPPDQAHGGRLTVTLGHLYAERGFRDAHPEAQEMDYWVLSVSDTGIGMDSRTVAKIFDPFFTTKQKDKGTGLGLAMVYNIIRQYGGFIDVYSEPGLGSTFRVYLPIVDVQGVTPVVKGPFLIPRGEGLVLVVDDEEMIRAAAEAILTECGFQVLQATNGEEGVRQFEQHHQEIKAVLLDMVMPKKSGKESFLEMRRIDPQVKVLLASGFKQDERVEDILNMGVQGFVQKPYTLETLSQAMHRLLYGDN